MTIFAFVTEKFVVIGSDNCDAELKKHQEAATSCWRARGGLVTIVKGVGT